MVCLDTTFVIDFLRGDASATRFLGDIQKGSEAVTIASPSVFELAEAAELAQSEREREAIHEFLQSITVLALDADGALAAGQWSAKLILAGEQIGPMDTLIGALAHLHGEEIVTRNVKHFERLRGLRVRTY